MSTEHETILTSKGCPIENFPEDPERLFSANGLTLDYPRIGWIVGGCCTLLATAISLVLIYRHYQYYTKPNQQRYIVRMLLMVPIYAITSWFSFVYIREAIYYETIRVFYEAFVIASFLILLLQYLGDSLEDQKRALKRHRKTERWFFPMCCLKYNPSRPHFLQYMKWGILQYVPLNVLGSLLTVVLETQGLYCESSWNPKFGHVWILFINFTSVTLATYFLIMFYFTIRNDLKEYDPFYKFLAIKLASKYWSTGDISIGINALLIDFEMVIFALIHLKAFSYKPYVPKIPNPEFEKQKQEQEQEQEQSLLSTSKGNDLDINRSHDPLLASLSVDTLPTPASGVVNSSDRPQGRQTGRPKRTPGTTSTLAIDSKNKKGSKSKMGKKDTGPLEKILDFTQKTPIWKGIIDSFNPLDTIRELSYGCKYMYKWIRGIPVDKDSRRLLDLEVAFGRVRPEVPYTPTKEELEKEKKKKKKKKGQETDEDDSSSNDNNIDDNDSDDDDKDLEKGTRRGSGYDDDDDDNSDDNIAEKDRRIGSDDGKGAGGVGHGPVSRYRQFPESNNNSNNNSSRVGGDRRTDTGEGAKTEASNRSTVTRKPVKGVKSTENSVLPRLERDPSIKMEKAEAARTERATLPDIQPDPVERKIALSGLYVDIPLSSTTKNNMGSPSSSIDIPIPMQYRHEHNHHYQVPYSRTRRGGIDGDGRENDWDYEHRQPSRDHQIGIHQNSQAYFEHRDRELERAAAIGIEVPYVLPTPAQPKTPEPHLPNTDGGALGINRGNREVGDAPIVSDGPPRGGLTRLANENFVVKGSPYDHDRGLDRDDRYKATGGIGFIRNPPRAAINPRITALSYYNNNGSQQQQGIVQHQRNDSNDTSILTITTNTDSLVPAAATERRGFYHHREASQSDPEMSQYGLDHEYYLDRMHHLDEQNRQAQYYLQLQQQQLQREERRRSQFPLQDHSEPSLATFSSQPADRSIDASLVLHTVTASAPDRTSGFIQRKDSDQHFNEMKRENKRNGCGSTLPLPSAAAPTIDTIPVDSQVPDPGKVIDDSAARAAAESAEQGHSILMVQEEDPIVAEYKLLQHRQKLQEQERAQQELQYQEQQQQSHLKQQQNEQKQRDHQQQQQQLRGTATPPPSARQQQQQQQKQRQLLPQRRNSLESLDSDSSSGGFRVHDYGFRPTVGGGVNRAPKSSRYQQAYRYPMPLPQPVPPAQLYHFPQDRELYDRQRREKARGRDWDRDRERERDRDRDRERDKDPRYHHREPQHSSRPYINDYSRQPYLSKAQSSQHNYPFADSRYHSPPPQPHHLLDDSSSYRSIRHTQEPFLQRGQWDRQDQERRRDRDREPRYTNDRYIVDNRDPYYPPESPSESLFPASRYAAPFVRDYEIQQRERDAVRRAAKSPPIDHLPSQPHPSAQRWQPTAVPTDHPMIPQPGRRGGGRRRGGGSGASENTDGASKFPPPRQTTGVAAGHDDDGPYEEAIVWTRSQPTTVPAPTLRN
ncbi:hypothetical protein FBU30_005071 [Linnemannia zychae]|nr:hypothetical protein FBU30_005071 [Linnemannia zychae]